MKSLISRISLIGITTLVLMLCIVPTMDGNGTKLDGINYYDYTQASAFQIPFYQRITNWLDKGDWAFFCDVDEMLTLDVGSIDKFISLVPNDVDCVLFNWKCHGDNGLDSYEDKPVWERFRNPAPISCVYNDSLPQGVTENCHVKALVRKTNKQIIWNNVHCPLIANGKYVNANLEQVKPSPWQKINWNGGYLNHFITKSRSEFIKRRLNKVKDATGGHILDENLIRWYENLNGRKPI